jgi:hypothetical protein
MNNFHALSDRIVKANGVDISVENFWRPERSGDPPHPRGDRIDAGVG